jgi:O-methyltransferase domain
MYLHRHSPAYIGGQLRQVDTRLYGSWGKLTQALRTGVPQTALANGYEAFYENASNSESFLEAMTGGSMLAARSLAARFPWREYRTVIDIGTAQGCVPTEIAGVHPHLTGGGFDLPQVEGAFVKYVAARNLSDRLKFFPFARQPKGSR